MMLSFTSVLGSSKPRRTMMICKHILQNLNELRHRDKLCDLQLLSEDGEAFNLHKCVFIAACKRQFDIACSKENEMHTSKMYKMILPQVSSNELKAMISFIYGENTQDTHSSDLLLALSKLHMLDLLENTDQSTTRLRIKEEPDVSVIVDVQVADDQEQQSPVKEPLLQTLLSEPEDFQIHTSTSGVAPDDFDGNNSDFELITLRQDRDRESTAVLKSIVSTAQDAYNNEESSDKELLSLKQECEELANNDPTIIEVKTEEDEHIEKLMDKISNELDLLKTPDQIPNSPSIANEINVGRNNGAEKVKTNLFPREAQTVNLDSTADSLLASDLVTQTFSSHSTILPKAVSPVRNLTAPSTTIIPIMISPMKEVKSKTVSSSKYKMILPRVSNPQDIQVLSDLLSPNTASNKISQGTNMTKLLQKTSSNSQVDITRKEELSGKSQENVQHKTIATLLALPPVMPMTSVDEKKIESSKNNNEQMQRTVINEKKIKSSKNSFVEMPTTIVNKKKIESKINSNVEKHMDKNTKVVDDSLNESPISSLCTEDSMERCDCDMSESDVTDKNPKDAPKVIETKQGDMENTGSLISHPRFDQLHQKKNAVRRIYAMRLGYKQRNRPPLKMCNLDCKHIRKKNLDFGVGQSREKTPMPTKNRAVFLQSRKSTSDSANCSSSDVHSGLHRSRQDSDKETIHTATADPDAPASLSLSEQVHEARDRRRRRKALHPLKRADKTDNDDENVKVEDTIELTESINTLMQSAAEIIGPESDCNENAVKIVSDLSITNTVKLPTDKDTTVTKTEDLTEGNIGTRMSVPTKIDDVNAERNVTQFRKDDHLRSAIAKASPLLVKLLSAIWKTEPTPPLRHCLAKDINPTSSLNYDSSNNDNQTNLDSSEVLDPREAHDEKLVVETKTAFDCKEKSKVPVSKSLKGQTMKIATASKGALVSKSLENQTLTGKAASVDKEQTPIPKSLEDQTLETASVSEEQAPLTKSLESPTTKLASVIQEKELTHVSKTLKDKVPVKPVSAYSPEIVKLLERKIDNFGPQKNDNTPFINKERQGVFEVFKQPVPNLKVENIKDESEVIVVEADHTENTTVNHETIIPIKTRQTTDSSDLKAKDNSHSKRPRKGTPKKHYLSVQQLLQIQPKVPQTILKPNLRPTILKPNLPSPTLDPRDISKQSKENSEIVNDARWSRKRPLSVTEVSDLKYTKKCKNVVSMQKQNPVVKERNPVGHSGEEILPFNGNIGNDKVRDNSQFIPFVSQGSSIEIVYNNQKNKSIKAQPVRIAPKPTETVKPVTILEESDLMCMNKSKSVISMKKRRPKIKRRNSLDPVGHSEEDLTFPPYVQGRKVNEKDRGNIQFIPPVSRGSSPVEIIYNNDTIKTIISQPPKIAPKPAETVKVLVKPFIIPEVNDLMCIKKSKSVISMKKRRPKIKRRNSLDAVRHTEGDLTPPPYVESGNVNEKDNLQFIPSVSQGSSVGIDLNNDEMKTIISQPAKVALKAAETVKPVATSEVSAVRKVDVEGRSVISRKKQRSKMKEINSLDPVGQSEEDLTPPLCVEESNVNEKDRANLQLNPSVFQGSSVEVVNKNDKSKTITSQPFKTITKVAEKPTSDSKPALIVMEPSAIKSRHNGKKYYARPLFATQQLVQSNAVFHDINSKPSKTHENDKEACKTDVNDQGLKQVILKTVQSYRPIAPKRLDDDK